MRAMLMMWMNVSALPTAMKVSFFSAVGSTHATEKRSRLRPYLMLEATKSANPDLALEGTGQWRVNKVQHEVEVLAAVGVVIDAQLILGDGGQEVVVLWP